MPVLAISSRVLARFGPWLGRLIKASPSKWTQIVQAISSKSGFLAKSVDDLVAYAKKSPLNAGLIFSTIASLGVSIADLFDTEELAAPESRKTATMLNMLALGSSHEDAMRLIYSVAAASEALKTGLATQEVQMDAVQTVCTWARGQFGSVRGAIQAHSLLQAFIELPLAEVEVGFRRLRT